MIADRLVDGARAFLGAQGDVAVGAIAPDGSLWASLWCGDAGFVRGDDRGEHVEIVSALDRTLPTDPVRPLVRAGAPLGILAIDFATRRRLRINGTVIRADANGSELEVREAFGNCPKYIQRRQRVETHPGDGAPAARFGHALNDDQRELIARIDTAFVASVHPSRGLDVSHRGGEPGFIWAESDGTLRMPDYPGNSMFQTLGNFEVDRRAGLALIDFDRHTVLSLSGESVVMFGPDDPRHPSGGTGRYWSFTVAQWKEYPLPSTLRWTLVDRSPVNPRLTPSSPR
jgi:hypothetical protein